MNQGFIGFGAGSSNQSLMGFDPMPLMAGTNNLQTLVPEGNVEVSKLIESIRANRMMFEMIRDDIKHYVCKRDGLDIKSEEWLSAGRMITKSEVLSINTYYWTSPKEQAQIELIFEQLSSELNEEIFNVADGSQNGKVLVKRNGSAPHSLPVNEGLPNLLINDNPQSNLIQPIA